MIQRILMPTDGSDLSERALAPPPAAMAPAAVTIAPPPAASVSAATSTTRGRDLKRVFSAEDSDVVAPVVAKQNMPRFPGLLTQAATGVIELVIDPTGNVESARLLETVHLNYDPLLLSAAKKWQYQPAMVDGTAVRYMKRIQISLAPEKPSQRR